MTKKTCAYCEHRSSKWEGKKRICFLKKKLVSSDDTCKDWSSIWAKEEGEYTRNKVEFSLDDPIEKIFPRGYRMCRRCGRYYHHPFKWCQDCLPIRVLTHREKKMSWRQFIKITANVGFGPTNTISSILTEGVYSRKEFEEYWRKNPKKHKASEEANRIHSKYHYRIDKVHIRDNIAFFYDREGELIEAMKIESWTGANLPLIKESV